MTELKKIRPGQITLIIIMIVITAGPKIIAQEIDLENQLILFLPMNGNAQDESGHSVPTLVEGPELTNDRHGIANSAYLFNGIDDNIMLNNN